MQTQEIARYHGDRGLLNCDMKAPQTCRAAGAPRGARATIWTLGGSSNGRTSGFGPENRGSNPCPPAFCSRRRMRLQTECRTYDWSRLNVCSSAGACAASAGPHMCGPVAGPHAALPVHVACDMTYSISFSADAARSSDEGGESMRASIPGVTPAPTVLILAAGQGTRMRSQHAEGAARAVRPADGAVARARGAGRGGGAGGRGRLSRRARSRRCCPTASSWRCSRAPNGTGGAVAAALSQLDADGRRPGAPVLVLSGDVPLVSAEAIARAGRRRTRRVARRRRW